jgi:polyprenyl-phospho-N-acetylgalactosaminyl synthase
MYFIAAAQIKVVKFCFFLNARVGMSGDLELISKNTGAWIVIAAFNESSVIEGVVRDVRRQFSNVVVVDDCSSDDTLARAERAGAAVCRHVVNLGQGAALQTGLKYALRNGADVLVTFDADGQHRVEDAVAMVERIASGDVDVLLGSRFLEAESIGMSKSKRLLLAAATIFTRLTTGMKVTDSHMGLRCFSRRAASLIEIRQNRMAHASEILSIIKRHRLRYEEFPCVVIYTEYSKRKGQRMTGAFNVVLDLILRGLYR